MTDAEDIQRLARFQASQAAMAFLSEKLDDDYSPPKPPEISVDETDVQPIKLDFLGFGTQQTGVTPGSAAPPGEPPLCPPCLRLTFHDIVICGCGETGTSASMLVTEINGGLSGFSVPMVPVVESVCQPFFGWGDYCSYIHDYGSELAPLHAVVRSGDTCSGSMITENDHWPFVRVLYLEGLWYVFSHLFDTPEPAALFSGSVASLGDSVSNEVYCTPDRTELVDWSSVNPIVACHGPDPLAGFAHDGTVTLESIACP